MKRNLLVMLSIVAMLLAFISCTNDNSSGLPDTEASKVAEKIDPVQLMNDALAGKVDGATVTFRQAKDAATLIAVVEFKDATYNGFMISTGRLSYTLVGNLTGSSFRATSYKVTTEVELSISEVSTGATATTVTIEVPETTTSSTGSSVTATVTANTEGEVKVSVSNVSISLPSTGAQVTVGGNDVTDTIDQEPGDRDPVGPTYQPISTKEELTAAIANGGYYRLTTDVALENTADVKNDLYIDLNDKILSSNYHINVTGAILSISNGTLTASNIAGTNGGNSAIQLFEGASLTLDGVYYTSDITGIFCADKNHNISVSIVGDSTVKVNGGWFAISTNAAEPDSSTNIHWLIEDSIITSEGSTADGDNTAMLFNVNGSVTISGSKISGDRQALILRGGDADSIHRISDTILKSTGTYQKVNDVNKHYFTANWGNGNEVPLAALVIGNRTSDAYCNPVIAELSNVTIEAPDTAPYYDVYVWKNSSNEEYTHNVRVTGSCKTEAAVNAEKNGADFNVTNTVILPSDVNAEMQKFMTAFAKVNNQFKLDQGQDSKIVGSDAVVEYIYEEGSTADDMYINLGNFDTVTSVGLIGREYTSTNDDILPVSIGNSVFYQDKVYKFDSEGNLLVNKAAFMFSLIANTGIYVNGEPLEGYSLCDDAKIDLPIIGTPVASGSGEIKKNGDAYDVTLTGSNVQIRYEYDGMESGDIVYVITKQNDEVSQNSLLISDDNGAYAYLTPWGGDLEKNQWIVSKEGFVLDSNGSYKGEYNLTLNITSTPQA